MAVTMSAADLISMSLRDIRVLGIGRPLNKALADMALPYLKMLIDAWAADGRTIYRVRRFIFDLQTGRNAYSIGPSGDFDINLRPRWIASANMSLIRFGGHLPRGGYDGQRRPRRLHQARLSHTAADRKRRREKRRASSRRRT